MLSVLVALLLASVLSRLRVRAAVRKASTPAAAARELRASAELPGLVGTALGLLAGGELLLEVPALVPRWWVVLPVMLLVTRLVAVGAWLDALLARPESGLTEPEDYGRQLGRGLRRIAVLLLPRHIYYALLALLASEQATSLSFGLLLAGYVALTTVLAPFLYILGASPRRPDEAEAARVAALSERYGLGVRHFRVVEDGPLTGANAFVAGLGVGHRIFVGRQLFGLPDDELAAVLAHECAHRDRHHGLVRAALALVVTPAVTVGGLLVVAATPDNGDGVLALLAVVWLGPWLARAITSAVCRAQEHDADRVAAERTGALAMAGALQHLFALNATPRRVTWWRAGQQSHPAAADRLARLRQSDGVPASSSSYQA